MKNALCPKVTRWIKTFTYLACILFSAQIVLAADYLGASAVLHEVEQRNGTPVTQNKNDASSKLREALKTFGQNSSNLPPAQAAKEWLELVDQATKVQQQSQQSFAPSTRPIQADDVLGVLPPPSSWNDLNKLIAARPAVKGGEETKEIGLRLLAASLLDDKDARNLEITNLQARAKEAGGASPYIYNNILLELGRAMMSTSDDPDAILTSLKLHLALQFGGGVRELDVPNLVSLIGAEKAESFLRNALVTPDIALQFNAPNETSRLAQKLAIELMPQLKTPQWGLVNSLDTTELYEAMNKRFSAATNSIVGPDNIDGLEMSDYKKQTAKIYYLLGLISKDRISEAVTFAKGFKGPNAEYLFGGAFKTMENAGYSGPLDNFLHDVLSQDATMPFWDEYVEVAAHAGQTERMLALVRSTISRNDLSANKQAALHQILFKALLAADDVEGGAKEAHLLLQINATNSQSRIHSSGEIGVMLARIGILLNKQEMIEEGIDTAKKWVASAANQNNRSAYRGDAVVGSLADMLFEQNRGPEAESILTDALATAVRRGTSQRDSEWILEGGGRQILSKLATLYYKAGRYDDVLILLKESPYWGAKDLSELFNSSSWDDGFSMTYLHTPSSHLPIPYLAASSLAAKGQTAEARNIADVLLNREPGLDRGYELLLKLEGTNAIPRLDEQFARDQFEERPLIWKAHLFRQQNQITEAEKLIRQAIAIDPSDGEEGRGDRMRAYAELADILQAQGKIKDADNYREIVKAIRLSEDADQFYQAGLLKRAIGMYEEALKHFSDAYCIQSRLAIQLAALGNTAEAEEHYRRAYELMPDSFGRVESHCFGCEQAFGGERAQSIAEKVFLQLAAKTPDKPQVHYLLGFLRQEQERYKEALTNYLTAVRLDPDYLNAWAKAQEVSQQAVIGPKERNRIAFNILRLDPLHRHAHPQFELISDLKGLWFAASTAATHQPPTVSNLYVLQASRDALAKGEKSSSRHREMYFGASDEFRSEYNNPAHVLAQTPFIRVAGEMIFIYNGIAEE